MNGIQKVLPRGWLVDLLAISVASTVLAHLAATLCDRGPPPPVATIGHRSPAPAAPKSPPIIARNLFCSSCGEGTPGPGRAPLPLTVVAILHAPPPLRVGASLAVVRDDEARGYRLVGVGDRLRDATVVAVGETRVAVSRGVATELLDLLARPLPGPGPAPSVAEQGIRRLADGSFEIGRATLEAVLADTPALLQAARILPELRDDRPAGFRLLSVRPAGVLARIGLRSGDVVIAVNGLPLTSPEGGLDAFVKLRSAAHLSLALERNGQRLTQEYRIR